MKAIPCCSALLMAASIGGTNGFVAPTLKAVTKKTGTELYQYSDSPAKYPNYLSEAEQSRQYRRTVYSHDDWRKHRSADRFIDYLSSLTNSGVYKNTIREVSTITTVAAFVCAWNALFGEYQDLEGVKHAGMLADSIVPTLKLPLTPFTLMSPSLGLLLVFRTNSAYKRWDEARKNWGMNINHTRDLVRMANTYYDSTGVSPEERQKDLDRLALCTWAFVRAMKRHLSPEDEDEEAFQKELYEKLPKQQAEMIIGAAHRPNRALQDLSFAIDNLPMHFTRKNEIHMAVTIFEDDLGSSERLLTSPVPLFYSRHLVRFLALWMLLLPFALYDVFASSWNHINMIPGAAILSIFLVGIEELATQLEEPFTILPMQAFCDKIYNWCTEIMTWSPGDNGHPMKPIKPEHAYFAGTDIPPMPSIMSPTQMIAPPTSTPNIDVVQVPDVEPAPAESLDPQQLSFESFLKSQGKKGP